MKERKMERIIEVIGIALGLSDNEEEKGIATKMIVDLVNSSSELLGKILGCTPTEFLHKYAVVSADADATYLKTLINAVPITNEQAVQLRIARINGMAAALTATKGVR